MKGNKVILILAVFLISGCGYMHVPTPGFDFGPKIEIVPPAPAATGQRYQMQYATQMFQVVYSYLFSVGGIWPWQAEYSAGEWTKWKVETNDGESFETELAYLKDAGDAKKWWRMSFHPKDSEKIVYEVLIDHSDYSVRRLRSKIGDKNPQEIPVAEGTYTYLKSIELTKESLEAATVKTAVNIKVPAGSFKCRYIKYGTMMGDGNIEIWANDSVPGGVVKYSLTSEGDGGGVTNSLMKYGSDAKTALGSY